MAVDTVASEENASPSVEGAGVRDVHLVIVAGSADVFASSAVLVGILSVTVGGTVRRVSVYRDMVLVGMFAANQDTNANGAYVCLEKGEAAGVSTVDVDIVADLENATRNTGAVAGTCIA